MLAAVLPKNSNEVWVMTVSKSYLNWTRLDAGEREVILWFNNHQSNQSPIIILYSHGWVWVVYACSLFEVTSTYERKLIIISIWLLFTFRSPQELWKCENQNDCFESIARKGERYYACWWQVFAEILRIYFWGQFILMSVHLIAFYRNFCQKSKWMPAQPIHNSYAQKCASSVSIWFMIFPFYDVTCI